MHLKSLQYQECVCDVVCGGCAWCAGDKSGEGGSGEGEL